MRSVLIAQDGQAGWEMDAMQSRNGWLYPDS